MKIGFIGLGNVGAKLAGSLLRNGFDLTVRDVDKNLTDQFKNLGAKVTNSGKELAEQERLQKEQESRNSGPSLPNRFSGLVDNI